MLIIDDLGITFGKLTNMEKKNKNKDCMRRWMRESFRGKDTLAQMKKNNVYSMREILW